jgi:hypothetical protein
MSHILSLHFCSYEDTKCLRSNCKIKQSQRLKSCYFRNDYVTFPFRYRVHVLVDKPDIFAVAPMPVLEARLAI